MPRHANTPDPRGAYQRARILAAVADGALTAQELADRLYLTRDAINLHLKAMRVAGLVHIGGWSRNTKGRPAPQYRPGGEPDVEYVITRTPTRHLRPAENQQRVIATLSARPMILTELSANVGLSEQWARQIVRDLRDAGQVRISGWRRMSAGIAPIYAPGSMPDSPRPVAKPGDAYKRLKERIKRDPDAADRHIAAKKRRALREKIKAIPPQPWYAALIGTAKTTATETA